MMLLLLTTITKANNKLKAYDCSKPVKIKNYMINQETCTSKLNISKPEKLVNATLLQKVEIHEQIGYRCAAQVSRWNLVCTQSLVANHQRLATVPVIEVPELMTAEQCRRIVTTKQYIGPDGKGYRLLVGGSRVLTFNLRGKNEVSGHSVYCEGERARIGGNIIDGVLTLEQVKIKVEKVTMMFKKHTIAVKEKHEILNCFRSSQDYCEQATGTYIWQNMEQKPYEIIQKTTGTIQSGTNIFISHHNKIRLVLKGQKEYSGILMKRTNFKNIVLAIDSIEELGFEEIKGNKVKINAWVAARDDYIMYSLEEKLKKVYSISKNTECLNTQQIAMAQLAMHSASVENLNYLQIKGETFGVIVGESIFQFECNEIIVSPRETNSCFRELPVTYNGLNYFLEPVSRLLTSQASQVPCTSTLPAKYQTIGGAWIATAPRLYITTNPKPSLQSSLTAFNISHEDMSQGGLYTEQQLEEFVKLIQYPRLRHHIRNELVDNLCMDNNHELCRQIQSTMGSSWLSEKPVFNLKQRITTFLQELGETAALFISVFIIIKLLYLLIRFTIGWITLRDFDWRRRMFQTTFLWYFMANDYAQSNKRKEESESMNE